MKKFAAVGVGILFGMPTAVLSGLLLGMVTRMAGFSAFYLSFPVGFCLYLSLAVVSGKFSLAFVVCALVGYSCGLLGYGTRFFDPSLAAAVLVLFQIGLSLVALAVGVEVRKRLPNRVAR